MSQTQPNLDAEINTLLASGIDIPASTLRQVLHDMNAAVFQSGIIGFATPSTLIGLTAQPGSSAFAMRADGAPALNQGIAPVWTQQHVFASNISTVSSLTGAIVVGGNGGIGVGGNVYAAGVISTGTAGPGNTTGQLIMGGSIGGTATAVVSPFSNTIMLSGTVGMYGSISPSSIVAGQRVTGTVSAASSGSGISMIIPTGVSVTSIKVFTTTAFASGTLTLTAGSAAGDTGYLTGATIGSVGYYNITWNGANAFQLGNMPTGPGGVLGGVPPPNLFLTLTQGVSHSNTGTAIILIDYIGPLTQ